MSKILEAVDKNRALILETERFIWAHPETGYKEFVTGKYMEDTFEKLGYELVRAENVPGFYTVLDTGKPGPEILILGELDSIICPEHPECNPETGAVHSCGHNAQCAALVGIAAALKEPGVIDNMCGKIKLCAVPAEELLELEYRDNLKEQGVIKYFGGKPEFMHRGYFDSTDIAFMVHTSKDTYINPGNIGCIAKKIIYKGASAHAGGSPWNGRNALYAANCGLNAINAIRETFKESDIIRVHPIITNGGAMVNAIPGKVQLESYIRGNTFEGIVSANAKVNRALCGAALSLGTNVEIIDIPGYAPLVNDKNMMELANDAAKIAMPNEEVYVTTNIGSACTDMGDLSCVMPVIHPHISGASGNAHGCDYQISDPEKACVNSAKWQLALLELLLENNAERANKVISEFTPMFPSKRAYLDFLDSFNCSGNRITYNADETATVKLV